MEKTQMGDREALPAFPFKRTAVNVKIELRDDHFLASVDVADGRIVCHTLSEVIKRLKPLLDKAFPKITKIAEKPKPKKLHDAPPERTGLPRTPFKSDDN